MLSTFELKVPIAKMRVFEIRRLYLFNAIPLFLLDFPGNSTRRAVPLKVLYLFPAGIAMRRYLVRWNFRKTALEFGAYFSLLYRK